MEKRLKTTSIVASSLLAGALVTFAGTNLNARPSTSQVLGNGAELRGQIIDLNINFSPLNIFEMKCGEAKPEETTKETKKEAKVEKKEGKAVEAKCGEGKCGEGKAAKTTETKTEKKEETTKTTEAKCGEGKCGVS